MKDEFQRPAAETTGTPATRLAVEPARAAAANGGKPRTAIKSAVAHWPEYRIEPGAVPVMLCLTLEPPISRTGMHPERSLATDLVAMCCNGRWIDFVAPRFTLEFMAKHSIEFSLSSEDLYDPNNRAPIYRNGKILHCEQPRSPGAPDGKAATCTHFNAQPVRHCH
jgi:hypothetical protein